MKKIILTLFCITLLSCVKKINLNTGESDYRIVVSNPVPPKDNNSVSKSKFIGKYEMDASFPNRIIESGESVSVYLKQAFIDGFSERTEQLLSKFLSTKIRGEIAIVARVFEGGGVQKIDFRNSATKKLGRLIYYSEDVRSGGQMLNQSMLPIYGPITYNGKPLIIQFTILELDVGEANQIKSLLSTMAELGAKAFAPSSPVIKSLEALGEQLLSGEQDDIEMQYHFVLYPQGGKFESAPYSVLTTGDYIIMRQEPNNASYQEGGSEKFERYNQIDWSGESFKYCPMHGRLIKKVCSCSDHQVRTCEFRDNTYLVVQINSGKDSTDLDLTQAFLEFQGEMGVISEKTDFTTEVSGFIDEIFEKNKQSAEKSTIEKLHSQAMAAIKIAFESNDDKIRDHNIHEFFDIVVGNRDMPENKNFSTKQWSSLLEKIRLHAKVSFRITKTAVQNTTTAKELLDLIIPNTQ